jgi:hypothetical protein
MNGLVYHAVGPPGDLAVKFSARDERQRAQREYGALLALRQAGLDVAPAPVLLDVDFLTVVLVVKKFL